MNAILEISFFSFISYSTEIFKHMTLTSKPLPLVEDGIYRTVRPVSDIFLYMFAKTDKIRCEHLLLKFTKERKSKNEKLWVSMVAIRG